MKKPILAICALISAIAHGADNDIASFIFRFSDKPGTYNIKVESVKDVGATGGHHARDYRSITKDEAKYTQTNDVSFADSFSIDKDATHIRISVRKQGAKGGGYAYISAPMLRKFATQFKNNKRWAAGVALENQFDCFARGEAHPAIEADSLFIQ